MSEPKRRDHFLAPPSDPPPGSTIKPEGKRQKRQATVYDAVAGRVSSTGFIPSAPLPSLHRDRPSSTLIAAPPEEVLFRRRNAPTRFAESDFYFANEHLPPTVKLPDSDLLKAIHTYASDFYARISGHWDWRSMDETALLAMGVLLEEAGRVALGETGDLVFVEEAGEGEGFREKEERSVILVEEEKVRSGRTRKGRKRRKVGVEGEGGGGDGSYSQPADHPHSLFAPM
ncbi:MAG: hypothetical protein M1813_000845 [Trichoglossum hirsutum]|nr:MAG: hypothetical protein M1813_000845 [Trichoglossum hirsutum]